MTFDSLGAASASTSAALTAASHESVGVQIVLLMMTSLPRSVSLPVRRHLIALVKTSSQM
jgi:hypothetical protein